MRNRIFQGVLWMAAAGCLLLGSPARGEGALPLDGSYEGHPSIAEWADQGYQLVIL